MKPKMSMSEAGRLGYLAAKATQEKQKQERINKYNLNPLRCQECNEIMSYEKMIKRRPKERKFCSHSCSAVFNNRKFPKRQKQEYITINGKRVKRVTDKCLFCGVLCRNKFCSGKCQQKFNWNLRVKKIEELKCIPNEHLQQRTARKYFLFKYGEICFGCGLKEWNNKPIPVVLDHINGNPEDFSLSNLRLLCCNCDAQTDTYKGKNKGNGRFKRRQRYRSSMSY